MCDKFKRLFESDYLYWIRVVPSCFGTCLTYGHSDECLKVAPKRVVNGMYEGKGKR